MSNFPRFFGMFCLCLTLQACGLLDLKDKALDMLVDKIPLTLEQSIGEQVLPNVLPPESILKDPESLKMLSALLQPLIEANSINSPNIRLVISKDRALNAFAIPGGTLIFNVGLLKAAETPEEILGVAAHEIAHATERHVLKSMVQTLSLTAALTFIVGDVGGLAAFLIQQSQQLLQNGFSRKQEAEADEVGFQYLVKAGINPSGLVRFFQRLQDPAQKPASSTDGMAKIENFLSTHPLTEERIKKIETWMKELSAESGKQFKPVKFPLKNLQARLPN